MFMKSLRLQYESEIAKAKDNIEVYYHPVSVNTPILPLRLIVK